MIKATFANKPSCGNGPTLCLEACETRHTCQTIRCWFPKIAKTTHYSYVKTDRAMHSFNHSVMCYVYNASHN